MAHDLKNGSLTLNFTSYLKQTTRLVANTRLMRRYCPKLHAKQQS
ncbi:hypothetical protein [Pontibacter rugosus]